MNKDFLSFSFTHFLFPLIILILIGSFIINPFDDYLKEVISFGLLTLIALCFVSLLNSNMLKKGILICFVLLLNILVFIKLSFYYNYEARLNASILFTVFETNKKEAIDFLIQYFNLFVIFLFIIILFNIFNYVRINTKEYLKTNTQSMWGKLLLIGLILSFIYILNYKFLRYNIPITSISSYKEYNRTKALTKQNLSKVYSKYISINKAIDEPQINIVIIGESTSKWHMQLYGYHKKTTPNLNRIKDELYVFKNVISPHVHTVMSLDKMLTLSDYTQPNKFENVSIVQLANHAGYETYWLSNQQPTGINDAFAAQIGHAAKHSYFLAKDDYTAVSHDEVLLGKLKEILNEQIKDKVVFIHLIGTHAPYKKRYPDNFRYFQVNTGLSSYLNKDKNFFVNHYDNAVRYNDYIVNSIIENVKEKKVKSSVIYFSDHGEDVYDTNENKILGHNESIGTKPMYEIPFIIWLSKEYKKSLNDSVLKTYLNRKYNSEDFYHTFTDLLDFKHKFFNSEKSIINENFKQKSRIIRDGMEYDENN